MRVSVLLLSEQPEKPFSLRTVFSHATRSSSSMLAHSSWPFMDLLRPKEAVAQHQSTLNK